jgi:hypothetical protein
MMSDFLDNLYCRKYRISFVATQPFVFNGYPYHLFRGLFGMVVRNEVCIKSGNEKCVTCDHNQDCPYAHIFEVKLPVNHPLYGKYTFPPVPYIIYPDLRGQLDFRPEDTFTIELTLIGNVIEYDTFLLHCIQRFGEGKGALYKKMECIGIETIVGKDWKSQLRFKTEPELIKSIKIRFESPIILRIKEEPAKSIPLDIFAERLAERLSLLSYLYCGANLPDFKLFRKPIHPNKYIDSFYPVSVEIHDGGNKNTPPKEGVLGSMAYCGNIGEYMPLIRAGETLHFGSYPNYGLGKYTIEETCWV